jgi:hypothetical protein
VIDSLKKYPAEPSKGPKSEKLDNPLGDNTSALRLAQMMGADYIVMETITSFGTEKKVFKGYGVETANLITHLRTTYKVLEGIQGGTLARPSQFEGYTNR